MSAIDQALAALATLPTWLVYGLLAAGAAMENVIPPVPADAFVVAGGVLAARGVVRPWAVFLVTWIPNVATATGIYFLGRTYGARFFTMPLARWLLREHQLEQLARFYRRFGTPAIVLGRLIPGWRAMIPVFAGISRMPPWRVVAALAVASAIWYALLLNLGAFAGRNLGAIVGVFVEGGRILALIGVALVLAFAAWWWRTRHPPHDP